MRSRNVTPAKNHIVRPLEEWTKTSLIVESSKINSYDETLDIPIIIVIQGIQILKKAILELQMILTSSNYYFFQLFHLRLKYE